jgi:trehalose/maltose transport system substrate-binding protein
LQQAAAGQASQMRIGLILLSSLALTACGGDETGTTAAPKKIQGAKVIDAGAMNGAKGNVNFCSGKDVGGDKAAAVKAFNSANPGITVKLIEFSTSADEQRTQFVQRQQAKSDECDVFYSDVIWTAEFASQKWLYDLTPYANTKKSELIPSTFETAVYAGKTWAVPHTTNAALMFYRTDQVDQPPATWQDVYGAEDGIVYQGAPYEGLTCDFLELAYAAGGDVLTGDGKKAVIDSPQNLKALQFMVEGVKNGKAANGVTTYMEEESRRYFESGKATYMRNWPYAYALGQKKNSKVAGKFSAAPLPAFEGGGKAAILGGHNLVISVYSKNPGASLKFIDYMVSPEEQIALFRDFSQAPTRAEAYDDPAVKKKYAFASQLKQSVAQAKARPVSPVYPQISQAIYENVNEALSGKADPKAALAQAQKDVQAALETF